MKQLETKLLEDKSGLEKQIRNLGQGLDFGADIDHFDEEADEAEELANRLGIKIALESRLERIEAALQKMKTGKYGICEKCGEEIDLKLLEADPESKLCRDCKRL